MPLKNVENGIRCTLNILAFISEGMLLVLLFLDAGDVIGRYLFNTPILGAMEISEVLMAGIILLSWGYTQSIGKHVKVELFISRYPARTRMIVNFATLLLSLVLFSVITWYSTIIGVQNWQEHRVLPTLQWPVAPFYFFVPVGAFFLCLEFIIQMLHLIPEIRKVE